MRTPIAPLALILVALAPAAAFGRALRVPDAFTPVLIDYLGDHTTPVKGTDGRWHVVYELWLTNARGVPATVERIEVLDYDKQDRVLKSLQGADLLATARDLAMQPVSDMALDPNAARIVFVELAFDAKSDVPAAIVHRFSGSGAAGPAAREPGPLQYVVAPWDLNQPAPIALGPPLRGKNWVAINGCCSLRGAHRGAVLPVDGDLHDAQRFAIDWMRIDAQGRMMSGDPMRVESFLAYDQPVLAIADATAIEVLDGLDDQVPGSLPDPAAITIANVDGNHVILDLGKGLYAFYAHLKKGTLRVKKGDRVRRGQELARLGNTGNTSAPHLHLQIMTSPSALAGDGVPYVFKAFTLGGAMDKERWYAPDSKLEEAYAIQDGDGRGPRRDELPLDLRIVDFP